ncbi:MAG: sulfatase family protein [Caulobacteraceae bacterium]
MSISRRQVLLAASANIAIGLSPVTSALAATASRPNIVFILADDMGVADASCYGAPQIRTPAIDRIAAEGTRFTQAYANSAVCTASRVAIITGRYQYRLPVGLEEPLGALNPVGLPPSTPTLPGQLKRAGYVTTLLGKWHLGDLPDYGPLKSGYDHFWGFRGGALDYFSHGMRGRPDLWDGDVKVEEQGYLTDMIGRRAVEIVKAHKPGDPPFFMSVHFNAPHWPWEGPGDEAESRRIGAQTSDLDGGTLATYNRMVEDMDRQIGLILSALDETGQANDTVVLFTSDNGGERFSTTWPFTGRKTELLEGGLRVPSVVRWPGRVRAGQVSSQMAIHMDWTPTLLTAAGIAPAERAPTDGIDLMPVLSGEAEPADRKLFWRYKANAQRAVREGPYKALKIGGNSFLFDVEADPMERANLKDRHADVFHRLTQDWDAWNRTMLRETPASFTYNNDGTQWADHMANPPVDPKAVDPGGPWPDKPVTGPPPSRT